MLKPDITIVNVQPCFRYATQITLFIQIYIHESKMCPHKNYLINVTLPPPNILHTRWDAMLMLFKRIKCQTTDLHLIFESNFSSLISTLLIVFPSLVRSVLVSFLFTMLLTSVVLMSLPDVSHTPLFCSSFCFILLYHFRAGCPAES